MSAQQLAAHTDLTGRVLLGRYRIVRELAKGGMGVVYLARVEGAVGFVKPVVVKLLLPEHTDDDRIVSMFVREARILAQLRHPSLVDVLEFGEQDGGYVLVLEYVRGYHLGLWLRYLAEKQRMPPADVLLQIVIDVLEALHHAHTQVHPDGSSMQIVHRDVSPSNILLDENGRGRLLDFGVARMRGGAQEYKTQVQGGFMGKLPYTAPEIFAGAEASPRSDLYACAVVLHEAIVGRNVFRGETQAATLQRVLSHMPEALEPDTPNIPAGLDAVLARALAKTPAERYADARELAMELRKLQDEPESEIRARLADMLQDDFGPELAKLFHLESLAERDAAWRRLSVFDTAAPGGAELRQARQDATATGATAAAGRGVKAPAAAGATVAARNPRRTNTLGEPIPVGAGEDPSAAALAPANDMSPRTPSGPAAASRGRPQGARTKAVQALGITAALVAVVSGGVLLASRRPADPPPPPYGTAGVPTLFHPAKPVPVAKPISANVQKPAIMGPVATPPPAAKPEAPDPTDEPNDKPRRSKGPNASALTRALRRQHTKLEACFNTHSVSLEGRATTQLIFDLAQDGTQTHVELSPPLLAKTELGQCLLSVARSTRFPPQPRAVSFAIPLTASTSRP